VVLFPIGTGSHTFSDYHQAVNFDDGAERSRATDWKLGSEVGWTQEMLPQKLPVGRVRCQLGVLREIES
jgi:hypothetical protein